MRRGQPGLAVLLCLGVLGGACSSRKDEAPPAPAAAPVAAAPAQPAPAPTAPDAAAPSEEKPDAGAAMTKRVECTLSAPEKVKAGRPLKLKLVLRNPMEETLYILQWHTLYEGVRNDILQVTRVDSGEELPYAGPMMKRGDPTSDDYVVIAPDAIVSTETDISKAYELRKPGRYRIAVKSPALDAATSEDDIPRTRDGFQPLPLECPPVEVTVTK